MKRIVILLALMLSSTALSWALGARVRAMGGAFIGLADDENAIFNNVAGLSQLEDTRYHLDSLLNSRDQYRNDSFAYASQIYERTPQKRFSIEDYLENEFQFNRVTKKESRYNYGISINKDYKSSSFVQKMMQDRQSDVQLRQQVASDTDTTTLNLGIASKFPMMPGLFQKNEVFGGMVLKYVQSKRDLVSFEQSISKDVLNMGVSCLVKTPQNLNFGLVLDAIVSEKVSASENTKGSSANLSLGMSYLLDRNSRVSMDLTNVLNAERAPDSQLRLGFERELIKDELALRLGSWDGTMTLGFGVKLYENMKIDYAYFNGDVLKEHYISTRLPF